MIVQKNADLWYRHIGHQLNLDSNNSYRLRLAPTAIADAIKALARKAFASEKAKEFKTKSLRSFYNSALLRADIKTEVKDLMMGPERASAWKNYLYDVQT